MTHDACSSPSAHLTGMQQARGGADLVVDAALLVARAGEVAAAAGDERDCERLAKHCQRSLLPEAVDERHHPAVIAQHTAQRPAVEDALAASAQRSWELLNAHQTVVVSKLQTDSKRRVAECKTHLVRWSFQTNMLSKRSCSADIVRFFCSVAAML